MMVVSIIIMQLTASSINVMPAKGAAVGLFNNHSELLSDHSELLGMHVIVLYDCSVMMFNRYETKEVPLDENT